ncbi:DeoR family transcriptional regulator [Lysobacteraceae bacterium NML93-0792]|nr:DeoR family transcriptional regulator [Xanthomonadaceae bacterium NML93-0792]PBS16568.1 DeoR family transcriptional regulator [Xanthomonadaceae bacterium NML93-0793]PBS19942.1 DeoR family transcriptional regulator [Xanthomonadaceae bacterium NML93-0831]
MVRVVHDMLPQERQQKILDALKREGRVVANELATTFGVSEDSVRRDLREMAQAGLCRRVYGGALLPTPDFPPLSERVATHDRSRSNLSRHAAGLVGVGQTVLLDAGSTNVLIARALRGHAVTVITNSPAVAAELAGDRVTELVTIGGRIDPGSGGAIGTVAVQQLALLQVDVCIPGVRAVEPEFGAWGQSGEEAAFKQAMVRASGAVIIVATDDKVGARGSSQFVGMQQIDHLLISDQVSADLAARFESPTTRIHRISATSA